MYEIGLFGPFSLKERRGNSIRIKLQAEGLLENGFNNFCVFSYEEAPDETKYKQTTIGRFVYPKILPLFQKIRKLPCKIVHVHHCLGAMLLRQKYIIDMPSFITLQTNEIYKHEGSPLERFIVKNIVIPLFLKRIEKKIIKCAENVIVASQSIKEDIIRHIPDIDHSKIVVITNPVNLSKYNISRVKDLVVGVAASDFRDNMDRACLDATFKVAQKLPDVKFIIAGMMSMDQKSMMKRLNNIEVRGKLSHDEYIEFLADISVFLNPYMSFWDYGGSKFKLLEAGAASLAVISSTNGAIGFPDKDCLCIADDIQQITESINKLRDSTYRNIMGSKLRKVIIEKHDYLKESIKLIEIYKGLLN
jgi:glycosyltransferase involved in cell wall biosynthesis